jgi:hypothetical protein
MPVERQTGEEVTQRLIRHAPLVNHVIDDFRRQGGQPENARGIPKV